MNEYLPTMDALPRLAGLLLSMLCAGYAVVRWQLRPAAWVLPAAAVGLSHWLMLADPAGLRMLVLIGSLLFAMKALVCVASGTRLTLGQWLAFAAGWFGMRPEPFMATRRALPGAWPLVGRGLAAAAAGAFLVTGARWLDDSAVLPEPLRRWVATAVLLAGLSLLLHFGIFVLTAAVWRLAGCNVTPLFRAPLAATSLADFWSRRWNVGFSEMTAIAVYRPVRSRWGRFAGLVAAFLASGLLHEVAISLPVRAGYGLPTLYFLIQGLLVAWERRRGRPAGQRLTLLALALPLPILFHEDFLAGVIWPLLK